MDSAPSLALDEIVHNRSDVIQWWVQEMNGQPMDENLIYRYVCESPFFDWTTKNGILFQQAQANMDLWQVTLSRKGVEDFLKTKQGTEFMIVGEPQPVSDKALASQGVRTGVWVIRKQLRERARDASSARVPGVVIESGWELTTLATYFIVGENMYQAPSVGDVIGNRLLSANSSMNKFIGAANTLPRYDPSTGYSYLPATTRATTAGSVTGSPSRSREGSAVPAADAQSLRSGSVLPDSHPTTTVASANLQNTRLLKNSLMMAIQFEDEFMDENPLQGEPGNFSFTSSVAAVKKRRADEEAAAAKAREDSEPASVSRAASPKAVKAQSPPAIFTDARAASVKAEKVDKAERRGSKMGEKIRRRKSRPAAATSPTTPASATSTTGPNSAA